MREVACRGLEIVEPTAVAHGLSLADLLRGLPVTPAQFRDPSEWIDWDIVAEVLHRLEKATSPATIVAMGRAAVDSEVIGPLRRIARLTPGPRLLYRAGIGWQLPLLYRNVSARFEEVGDKLVRVEVSIPRHYRGGAAWMRYLQGGLEALGTLTGHPRIHIDAEITPHWALFVFALPKTKRSLFGRFLSFLENPALAELERQVEELRAMEVERERVDRALRDRERMLANLIANLSGMVYRARVDDFGFEFVSDRCFELTGYLPVELVAKNESNVLAIDEADAERVLRTRRMALASHQPISIEYRIRTRAGEVRWVLDVARGVYDVDGRPSGLEGFMTDVTERKRLEEELNHALRVEGIGRLAGGIAHDFNNLLSVILGSAELARRHLPERTPAREHTDQIIGAAERAAELTRQLLAVARKQVIEPRVVDLNALVLRMDSLLRRTLREDIELSTVLADGLWNVLIDPGQLEQVVLNLAINARDAMPRGGTLTVETANIVLEEPTPELPGLAPGLYAMLCVSDTGVGMNEEVRRRAFDPFFTTKGEGRGSGLGLASAHGIVRQAHGKIFLSSELGKGTLFRIYFPRASGEVVPERNEPPRALTGRSETVLVVEDHAVLRDIVVKALVSAGYRVLSAAGGTEALACVAQTGAALDLLVTDVVMPQMSGLELAAALGSSRPGLPVLFVSGYSEQNLHRGSTAPHLTSFLPKPFTPNQLAVKVREVLDRAHVDAGDESRSPHLRLVR